MDRGINYIKHGTETKKTKNRNKVRYKAVFGWNVAVICDKRENLSRSCCKQFTPKLKLLVFCFLQNRRH